MAEEERRRVEYFENDEWDLMEQPNVRIDQDTNSGEAPVPSKADIQFMLAQFHQLSDENAPVPAFSFPCDDHDPDLPAADLPYHLAAQNGTNFLIQPIFYDALPYVGNKTKVFAWIGLPTNGETVPGMVCVHGGGGTAFKVWVEQWVRRGYAAISIAVEGQTDEPNPDKPSMGVEADGTPDNNPHNKNPSYWVQHSHPGPRRPDVPYADWDVSLLDQWMFHAVADALLANTLLRSFDQIDASRVGLTGISWGGVITSTAAGLDARFSHVIPIYGCGHLGHAHSYLGRGMKGHSNYYDAVWDACLYLPAATMPSLWISWPEDPHFPMIDLRASYEAIRSPNVMVSLIPGMEHGHGPGWSRPESYVFSKCVWGSKDTNGWCHQVAESVTPSNHNNNNNNNNKTSKLKAKVVMQSQLAFDHAELVWTLDSEDMDAQSRQWNRTPAVLKCSATKGKWAAEAILPEHTESWLINFCTDADPHKSLVASSVYQDLNLFAFAVNVRHQDAAVESD